MADKKYYTHISKEEMLKAQKDPEAAYIVIKKMRPFLGYLAQIVYNFYGASKDSSLDMEDIMSFLDISMLKAIKSYDPSKYDAAKDKSGGRWYLDGYRYLSTIGKRSVKYFHNYHHRQKRIPPEFIQSLDPLLYSTEADDSPELSAIDLLIDGLLEQFKDEYHNGIHVYDVMKLLFEGLSHRKIAEKIGVSEDMVLEVIKKSMKEPTTEPLNQTFFRFTGKD